MVIQMKNNALFIEILTFKSKKMEMIQNIYYCVRVLRLNLYILVEINHGNNLTLDTELC